MAETHHRNPAALSSVLHSLDPVSLLLAQNLAPDDPLPLRLVAETFYAVERGPRYGAYAELRESRLRMKTGRRWEEETPPPPQRQQQRKQVKFQTRGGPSGLAQSVPDFSSTIRKENRRPAAALDLTPPSRTKARVGGGALTSSRGSKSVNAGEKRGLLARKSYATVEELKGLSHAAASGIAAENRGGKGPAKTILGYRQF